jgi:hypothetical protein
MGIALATSSVLQAYITQYNRFDPYPVYRSLDSDIFLNMFERLRLKGIPNDRAHKEWFGISISPFGQNAIDYPGLTVTAPLTPTTIPASASARDIEGLKVPIGDLDGRWGMIGLLYGATPVGTTFPPLLLEARNALFPTEPAGVPIDDSGGIDPKKQWGFFEVAGEYRKRGVRAEFEAQILNDFGIDLQLGFSDIMFTATLYNDLTVNAPVFPPPQTVPVPMYFPVAGINTSYNPGNPNFTFNNIEEFLMYRLREIGPQINLDLCDFHCSSIEDIRAGLYWRHAYPMNGNRARGYACDWAQFLLIPWAMVQGSAAVSKDLPYNVKFGVPFGNHGHHALGFCAGLNLDFTETIEVGCELGATHFFDRDFCNVPVPTSKFQSNLYPFQTTVNIQPGQNLHFGAKMFAYQFLGCLSFTFKYIVVLHRNDTICLKPFDPAFLPKILECKSSWLSQVANVGFNYDVSPYISLGFLWQAPLTERNAVRSTTLLFSFNASY